VSTESLLVVLLVVVVVVVGRNLYLHSTVRTWHNAGGQSRLDGGMRYGAAVPGGEELCSGISGRTLDGILSRLGLLKASRMQSLT